MKTISLTQGKAAIVDDEDYDWLNQVKWYTKVTSDGYKIYAARFKRIDGRPTTIYMHRAIMGGNLDEPEIPQGYEVDHDNDDGLDNRRENLKIVTKSENCSRKKFFKENKK